MTDGWHLQGKADFLDYLVKNVLFLVVSWVKIISKFKRMAPMCVFTLLRDSYMWIRQIQNYFVVLKLPKQAIVMII